MGERARRTESSAANVSKLVTDMAGDGLVTRAPSALDGRVLLVSVTPAGATAVREAWNAYLDRVSVVFEPLPDVTRASIREALDTLFDALPDDERPR